MTKEQRSSKSEKPCKYGVAQLVASEKFKANRDALNAILDKDKQYTIEEVQGLLKEFYKRKVN